MGFEFVSAEQLKKYSDEELARYGIKIDRYIERRTLEVEDIEKKHEKFEREWVGLMGSKDTKTLAAVKASHKETGDAALAAYDEKKDFNKSLETITAEFQRREIKLPYPEKGFALDYIPGQGINPFSEQAMLSGMLATISLHARLDDLDVKKGGATLQSRQQRVKLGEFQKQLASFGKLGAAGTSAGIFNSYANNNNLNEDVGGPSNYKSSRPQGK